MVERLYRADMATRRKIPVGAGSFFVLTPKTLRFPIDGRGGELAGELLVNANGNGAIALVPPGCKLPDGVNASRLSPIDAVELLRRVNLHRLTTGLPELAIPAALVRRAKAETLPGIEALVPFPGKLKKFFEGRGTWADTGLWVSADGLFELEMSAAVGFLRKRLTQREAELWLRANGHPPAWDVMGDPLKQTEQQPDQWRIATRGHQAEGKRSLWAFGWDPKTSPKQIAAQDAKDRQLREAIKRARTIAPPAISPPRKPRRPRRGK